jgi:hypothetical protein
VYGLQAPYSELSQRLQPSKSDILAGGRIINIRAQWNPSKPPYDYRLVQLRWQGYLTDETGLDKIYIWEHPQPGETYGIGIDSSAGIGLDRTAMEIFFKANPMRPYTQCAEFASDRTTALDVWPLALALGTYYAVPNREYGERVQPKIVCETMSETDLTQLELRKRGWWNFHDWKRIDAARLDLPPHKLGWHTTPWSRRQLIAWLISLVRNRDIDIRSIYLVNELGDLAGDEESQKIKAVQGGHDDRAICTGFLYFSMHWREIAQGLWTLDGTRRIQTKLEEKVFPKWTPSVAERCFTLDEERVLQQQRQYENLFLGDRYGY